MKYLFLLLFSLPLTTYGQFTKGDIFLGGSFGFSTRNSEDNLPSNYVKSNIFSLQPQFGYFLNNKLALGGNLGFSTINQEAITPNGTRFLNDSRGITIGFILRRYFQISDKFFISIDGNTYFENRVTNAASTSKSNFIGIDLSPVFSFFPSNNWAIEAGIGSISYEHVNHESGSNTNIFEMNYGSLNLGLTYFFRREVN